MARANGPKVVQSIRKIRHWKQRYDPKARFVFRRATSWPLVTKDGKIKPGPDRIQYPAGSIIPDAVVKSMGAKLRRWWEGHLIELHEFKAPNVTTGVVNMRDPTGKLSGAKQTKKKGKKKGKKKNGKKLEVTDATRALVVEMVVAGATKAAMARALETSVATLKRHFSDELSAFHEQHELTEEVTEKQEWP